LIQKKRIEPYSYESLYGATKPMRELYNRIGRYAPKDEPLLLLGETGTGKELVARELHNKSGRTGAFAPINLAESNSELIADEIFGHTKGAFSGASQFRTGWIATAQNGTVFFDEIGELEPSKQVILLRVVERNQVHRVGSDHLEDVNARFIFATNQNLEERISQNLFREDLYQRIDVLRLDLPPLRIRKADIPLLVEHFVDKYGKTKSLKIMPDAFDVLFRHDWPGNVRELHHIVVKAVALLDENGVITYSLLQELIRWPKASQANSIKALQPKNAISFNIQTDTWPAILHRARGLYFKAVTEAANGSIDEAKRLSGMEKAQIYKILGEHGLSLKQKPPTRDSD
jgi:DNA-binding NtrC family response regulator